MTLSLDVNCVNEKPRKRGFDSKWIFGRCVALEQLAPRATAQGFGRFAELDAAVKTVKLLRTSFGLEFEPKQFAVDFRDVLLVDRKMTPKRAKYHNYRD